MNYLDFEEPIKTLREQLEQAKDIQDKNDLDMTTTIEELEVKIAEVTKEIYSKLTAWQRVQVSRHPDRPYTLDYIEALTDGNFMELHGDRTVKDDKAMVGGLGELDGRPVCSSDNRRVSTPKCVSTGTLGWPTQKATEKPCG